MKASLTTAVTNKRITIIDALRGFALAGIVICHVVENYIGSVPPANFNEAVHQGVADNIVDGFIGIFLRGKFIALFSFLFGLSFFIQMDNGDNRGGYYGWRFLWRLLLLFAIGYVHHLFYRGDILTVYAFLGIFLIPFYRVNNKWILGIAAVLFFGLARFIVFYVTNGEGVFGPVEMDPSSPKVLTYYDTLKNGTLAEVFATNATQGHVDKAEFQYGIFGRGYFTFAFFLIGLYVGRSGFFKRFKEEKKLTKKVLIYASVALVVFFGIMATAFASMGENFNFNSWNAMIGLTAMDLANFAMTLIYIALFTMLFRKAKWEQRLDKFAPYGRMALTNYVFQSVLFTFMLFGWGLGLIGELRQLYTFLIAIAFIALQMWFSKIWLDHFKYGPLEWLWRSATFFKWFPMKKSKPTDVAAV
ncbi:DUF418 domain-containing protein [Allomuricauda sp. d1]|uniref:DUF418 domain-containing protein n=1 Tax=Allomuricauda sp. d1 TaxID=3136725 RepID=UPI0031D971CF